MVLQAVKRLQVSYLTRPSNIKEVEVRTVNGLSKATKATQQGQDWYVDLQALPLLHLLLLDFTKIACSGKGENLS